MNTIQVAEHWWEIHPVVLSAEMNGLPQRLGWDWSELEVEGAFNKHWGYVHLLCPIHRMNTYDICCIANPTQHVCSCTGESITWRPLQFIAAYRKCSLEEALVELCKLFPPSKS